MNLPVRLENALAKLYYAYNNDMLHPEDACRCAVGNILNGKDVWKHLSDDHGSLKLNYVGKINELANKKFSGYAPSELLKIEYAFLQGCGYSLPLQYNSHKPDNPTDKMLLFEGLCAAIAKLCELDTINDCLEIENILKPLKKVTYRVPTAIK